MAKTTNQLVNEFRAVVEVMPIQGMAATVRIGSDSYPYTVTHVERTATGYDVQVQEDDATVAEGHNYYGTQKYDYAPNPKGEKKTFRYCNRSASWREIAKAPTGRYRYADRGYRLVLGTREKYDDPSF